MPIVAAGFGAEPHFKGAIMNKLLEIKNLQTSFRIGGAYHAAVDDISLTMYKNEVFALVGESGSGKSAMALSIPRLHNAAFTQINGQVIFDGKNLLEMDINQLNKIRGADIGMVFQDSLMALNPLMPIGAQIEEALFYHTGLSRAGRREYAHKLIKKVGLLPRVYSNLPHELSGGMRQRVSIAIATSCNPRLIIADEPTTALDVTIQAAVLDLLKEVQTSTGASILLITHDLGVVAEIADRVAVMYAGQIVEIATTTELFAHPAHPYTRALIDSMTSFVPIKGIVPALQDMPRAGCRFSSRADAGLKHEDNPTYHEVSPGHFVLCSCWRSVA